MTPTKIGNAALIPIDLIDDHPDNPRAVLTDLEGLAVSIRQRGVLSPCTVRPVGDRFQLLAGHRRKHAALLAGQTKLPCVIRTNIPADAALEVMLAENIQRADLNPIEEAKAFDKLTRRGVTQREIAVKLGISEERVTRRLGLLLLDEATQQMVIRKALTMAEAWDLVREVKPRRGPKPGEGGRSTRWERHFNSAHPLAMRANHACSKARHPEVASHLGPACGECWEAAIRADERERTIAEIELEADVEATHPSAVEVDRAC